MMSGAEGSGKEMSIEARKLALVEALMALDRGEDISAMEAAVEGDVFIVVEIV